MKTAEQLILTAKSRIQEVSVHDLFDAMKNHKTILIDVREPEEFQASAIDRAVNYPRGVLEMRIHQHPLASHHCDTVQALEYLKDQPIYLICGTGGRSALATDALQNMGFTQVKSVQGGYQAWLEQAYPVEE
ncbi:rhodanese-like domain-containing protein [Acinetobacter bohemicus]|jgi:rhodanese-related sulfurtransferase|uniref:Rhodanese-related sulfurtransferase n=1 Tax=Acinetobacter bohemicus TaxID=1435036 RepID=A0A1I6WB15_9GAMM|nr:rhodanese-like domain-containing protein [Acinetobacter bohemicus]KAB0650318.1 rhodanese-like domain-containing protein [Acinetobacter bohemicus]SFT23102.1 Rhodanese-related sulfurtransferase [Acinetobacter bohemicus]